MMVFFDFLSKPITMSTDKVSVLCIENHRIYRKTVESFYNGCPDESSIVFSENFSPIKFKNKVCFISNFFDLSFSIPTLKNYMKIYLLILIISFKTML